MAAKKVSPPTLDLSTIRPERLFLQYVYLVKERKRTERREGTGRLIVWAVSNHVERGSCCPMCM